MRRSSPIGPSRRPETSWRALCHRTLVEGGAVQALLDAGETAALIVVGSRGRGGFRTMLLGSVAHRVAGHAACPIVVAR
jgi:nucleotide-binding universal stress UspA family protein